MHFRSQSRQVGVKVAEPISKNVTESSQLTSLEIVNPEFMGQFVNSDEVRKKEPKSATLKKDKKSSTLKHFIDASKNNVNQRNINQDLILEVEYG